MKKTISLLTCSAVTIVLFLSCIPVDENKIEVIVLSKEDSKKLKDVKITLISSSGEKVERLTNEKGKVSFTLSCQNTYVVTAEKGRFFMEREKIDNPCDKELETVKLKLKSSWIGH